MNPTRSSEGGTGRHHGRPVRAQPTRCRRATRPTGRHASISGGPGTPTRIVLVDDAAEAARSGLRPPRPTDGLTERDIELLRLVSRGFDNIRIAQQLYLSPKTVRNRVSSLYAKLGVRSRAEAIARARDASID